MRGPGPIRALQTSTKPGRAQNSNLSYATRSEARSIPALSKPRDSHGRLCVYQGGRPQAIIQPFLLCINGDAGKEGL